MSRERGIQNEPDGMPYTGTGHDKPAERSLPNAGRRIRVVQRTAEGEVINRAENPKKKGR